MSFSFDLTVKATCYRCGADISISNGLCTDEDGFFGFSGHRYLMRVVPCQTCIAQLAEKLFEEKVQSTNLRIWNGDTPPPPPRRS